MAGEGKGKKEKLGEPKPEVGNRFVEARNSSFFQNRFQVVKRKAAAEG
jgi:hypothetical protein